MVVNLPPATINFLENATSADSERYFFATHAEISTLSPYSVKHLNCFVNGVVKILDVNFRSTVKNTSINWLYFAPTALDSTKRIVHCNLV